MPRRETCSQHRREPCHWHRGSRRRERATRRQTPPHPWSWAWKIAFTVITLSCGFKGGEVTPLFFIGAALGNALAGLLGAPPDLFAALGFVAVFAGAANTPLACMIMGVELFGSAHVIYIATACFVAYICSGHSGIYRAQRLGVSKTAVPPPDASRDGLV